VQDQVRQIAMPSPHRKSYEYQPAKSVHDTQRTTASPQIKDGVLRIVSRKMRIKPAQFKDAGNHFANVG
jgi:hypothetical protein